MAVLLTVFSVVLEASVQTFGDMVNGVIVLETGTGDGSTSDLGSANTIQNKEKLGHMKLNILPNS